MKDFCFFVNELRGEYIATMGSLKNLTESDWAFITETASRLGSLDVHARQLAINQLWTDKPNKPKRWVLISEILQMANSRHVRYLKS